ncbi:hypothetical protein MBLNU230_g5553t1 [Neophaeotheca triangularis]
MSASGTIANGSDDTASSTSWTTPGAGITNDYNSSAPSFRTFVIILVTLSIYNALELIFLIFSTFTRRRGLYFYALLTASIGIIPYALGFLLKFLNYTPDNLRWIAIVLLTIGWYPMITGESLVLWSRLHLILSGSRGQTILKTTKWMIITTAILLHIPTTILTFGANSDTHTTTFETGYNIMEKIQMIGFFLQEVTLSLIYIIETSKLLRTCQQKPQTRKIMNQLIFINVIIIIMDLALLGLECASLYIQATLLKGVIYSIKLKLEFAILGKIVNIVRPPRNAAQGYNANANNNNNNNLTPLPHDSKNSQSSASDPKPLSHSHSHSQSQPHDRSRHRHRHRHRHRNPLALFTSNSNSNYNPNPNLNPNDSDDSDSISSFVDLNRVQTDLTHASASADVSRGNSRQLASLGGGQWELERFRVCRDVELSSLGEGGSGDRGSEGRVGGCGVDGTGAGGLGLAGGLQRGDEDGVGGSGIGGIGDGGSEGRVGGCGVDGTGAGGLGLAGGLERGDEDGVGGSGIGGIGGGAVVGAMASGSADRGDERAREQEGGKPREELKGWDPESGTAGTEFEATCTDDEVIEREDLRSQRYMRLEPGGRVDDAGHGRNNKNQGEV